MKRAGYTLVELLVACLLIALVLSAVYTMFFTVIGSWKAVEKKFDPNVEARNFFALMESELGNILPASAPWFEGTAHEVLFFSVAAPLQAQESLGPRLMRLHYSLNRTFKRIDREEAWVRTALPQNVTGKNERDRQRIQVEKRVKFPVAESVSAFTIQYVWVPAPVIRDPNRPVDPTPPIYSPHQRKKWGLPQALQVKLELLDPDTKKKYPFTTTFPLYTPNVRRDVDSIHFMFREES